jgi:hypothetical protein
VKNKHIAAAGIVDYRKAPDDMQTFGTPNWVLLHGASSMRQSWTKSTTAIEIPGLGVLVRTAMHSAQGSSEALCMVNGAMIKTDPKTALPVLVQSDLLARFSTSLQELLDANDKRKKHEKKTKRQGKKPAKPRYTRKG